MAPEDKHLEALTGLGVGVEPDQRAVAPPAGRVRDDGVSTGYHVQRGAFPIETVAAGCQGGAVEPAGVVPELERVIGRVVPGAVVEWRGDRAVALVEFEVGFGGQHRRGFVDFGGVVDAAQRGVFDQEVVDEELAAYVDGDDSWRVGQVGNREWVAAGFDGAWRPFGRELDAVVEG